MKDNSFIKGSIILGLSFFLAVLLIKPVGVSTQFSVLSGIIHNSLDKNVIYVDNSRETGYKSNNVYYDKNDGKLAKSIKNPINYDFVFVLSIPLGSFIGYKIMKKNKKNNKKEQKSNHEGRCSLNKRVTLKEYLISFIGGFILLFGARMADGCTSGHMMSGMMQGSVSGYVFAAAVFLTAIPTAIIINNTKEKR